MEMDKNDDLLPEYEFDYSKSKPSRFAEKYNQMQKTVILDSDVAQDFPTSKSVNEALRMISRLIKQNQTELTHK